MKIKPEITKLIFILFSLSLNKVNAQDINAGISFNSNIGISQKNYTTTTYSLPAIQLKGIYTDIESENIFSYGELNLNLYIPDKDFTEIEIDSMYTNSDPKYCDCEVRTTGLDLGLKGGIRLGAFSERLTIYTGLGFQFGRVRFNYTIPENHSIVSPIIEAGSDNEYKLKTFGLNLFLTGSYQVGYIKITGDFGLKNWLIYNQSFGVDSFNKQQIYFGIGVSVPVIHFGD